MVPEKEVEKVKRCFSTALSQLPRVSEGQSLYTVNTWYLRNLLYSTLTTDTSKTTVTSTRNTPSGTAFLYLVTLQLENGGVEYKLGKPRQSYSTTVRSFTEYRNLLRLLLVTEVDSEHLEQLEGEVTQRFQVKFQPTHGREYVHSHTATPAERTVVGRQFPSNLSQ